MNGIRAKGQPLAVRLAALCREMCYEKFDAHRFPPDYKDFEEIFTPILRSAMLEERIEEQVMHGQGAGSQRVRDLVSQRDALS